MSQDIDILSELYRGYAGSAPETVSRLPGAGSGRTYFRLSGKRLENGAEDVFSCIGVVGDTSRDCRAFVRLSEVFGKTGINVPCVFAVTDDYMHYIQQDLGSVSLFDLIRTDREEANGTAAVGRFVKNALTELAKMQSVAPSYWEDLVEYKPFGIRQAMWDLNYFKYEYLRPSGIDIDEDRLEDDFERFAGDLCGSGRCKDGFMYRDFQSRNIMICNTRPYFIDFQGGRRGPGIYDAISFLWQARAGFSDNFRKEMLDHYFGELSSFTGERRDKKSEHKLAGMFALFRTLQVLGAYGLRGLVERKAHFIESIPSALKNLKSLVDSGASDRYPELKRICGAVCKDPRFCQNENERLCVSVFSFSYKKGYPSDFTGNGGGFMFDCRGMHNPGRYAEYKTVTGRDKPVIDFLEDKGEVQKFVLQAVELVSPSIETYLRRGFSNLQIGFGCTGGQHRSVYCAEHAARLLADRYPEAKVVLIHREQGMEAVLPPTLYNH